MPSQLINHEVDPELGAYLNQEFAFCGVLSGHQPLMIKSKGYRFNLFLNDNNIILLSNK